MNQDLFTVSELNQFIKGVIQAGFPQEVWVCGEIQGFDRNRNKNHVFFELVEKDKDSQDIKSRISLVIFSGRKSFIQKVLKQNENAFALKDDIEVKFLCKVDYYAPHGAVRLVVENIDPVYTLGKLAQEKQKLIALLKEKGILDKNKQRPLSLVPLRIGVITSDDSAAYNDFLSELKRSDYGFSLFVRNTLMQGKKAESDVCQALKQLQTLALDVIVITRGGGSLADLSCFDSRMIAETIAASTIPIFSGIGHEINITITDMAAHTHAKTPTAIAQILVLMVQEYCHRLNECAEQLRSLSESLIEGERQRIRAWALQLKNNTNQYLKFHNETLIRWREILKQRPILLIKEYRKILSVRAEDFRKILGNRFRDEKLKIKNHQKIIDVIHPINTLKRGFSISRDQRGQILKDIQQVHPLEQLSTEISNGVIHSTIKEIKK